MTPRLDSLREALVLSPQNVPLLLLFGQTCLDELNFDEARAAFDRVLQYDPANAEAKLGIAGALYLSGNISEAVVRTEALVKAKPSFAEAWILLARLALAEGDQTLAAEYYQNALGLNPNMRNPVLDRDIRIESPTTPADVPVAESDARESSVELDGDASEFADLERPEVSFASVGGMEEIKEEIRMKIIYPLKNRALFKAYGKKLGGGVLLYGPPGCGKTLISKATAGEIQANFISVGIHQILDFYIGNSEKNLHQLFQLARDNPPAILFFDEVDALAADRKDFRESAIRTVINQFLAEMDGNIGSNEGILILGATNAPWHLDPAFRRPGRFDRVIFVPPPDEPAREAIVTILGRDKPLERLDAKALAKRTKEFSGADLKSIFDIATERVLSRAMKEGRVVPLTTEDLLQACKGMKASTRAWFESAKNYALYANQGGFYDDVLTFLGIRK
ncbi:MAG TPA: AAA family ATPase [Chthoniobacterales bacterium]|jgi:SpoVK/Ycf46/Vps4 family AAA+-type ATPase|nr:AAA family ATPase [Chthoniobacterales bacterium]